MQGYYLTMLLDIIFLNGKMLITDLVKNTDYMYR